MIRSRFAVNFELDRSTLIAWLKVQTTRFASGAKLLSSRKEHSPWIISSSPSSLSRQQKRFSDRRVTAEWVSHSYYEMTARISNHSYLSRISSAVSFAAKFQFHRVLCLICEHPRLVFTSDFCSEPWFSKGPASFVILNMWHRSRPELRGY